MSARTTSDPSPAVSSPSNWGRWGDDDEVGTLNHIDPARVIAASGCVRSGQVIPLNLPMDLPSERGVGRPRFERETLGVNKDYKGLVVNDDIVRYPTQGSTQWDSFAHIGLVEAGGAFYNGIGTDAIDETGFAHRGGIAPLARRGIVGRGVLVDVVRHLSGEGGALAPGRGITLEDFLGAVEAQGLTFEPGDVVCLRTGWTDRYLAGDVAERLELSSKPTPGLTPDPRFAVLADGHRWAALAADNLAVEVTPLDGDHIADSLHIQLLRNLGVPLGELFSFGDLADACAADGRWDFLFVSCPQWIPGGVGSPANAIAIR